MPGPPPYPPKHRHEEFVVYVRRGGWIIGKWHELLGVFIDSDRSVPMNYRLHRAEDLLWWMPANGRRE
jgi:hypothetical protein